MKKTLAIIIAILMLVTMIPFTPIAFAAEEMTVLTEFCVYEDDYSYPGGWSNDNEENYHLGIQDEGKIAWEEGDELLIIFDEYDTDTWEKINTQTALLRYENEQFNGSISFVYDENSYIKTYGCIGKGGGTDEYLEIHCVIIDNVLYIVFPYSRVHYSRLRIVGEVNTSYDVTVDGFITADNFEKLITQNYTLTTDNNGNAYLYGIFIEGAILSVNGVSCTFDPPEPTISEKSYAVCAVHNFSDGYCTECYVKCVHANCSNSVCNDCGYICLHSDTLVQVDAKAPTCTQVGNEAYEYCTVCDYTTTYAEIPVDTDAHDIVIDEAVAPKCGETGLTQGEHCTRCDYKVEQEIVPALNHKDTLVQVDAKAPTCTEIGWEAYEYCKACDYTTYEELPASHNIETVDAKAPTCTEIGWDAYEYCTACDYTTYVEIPALGHADADNDGVCDNGCGAEVVTLGGNVYPVDGDITNTGIYIGAFAAFDNCYKAGDGYILIKGEGNNDTVMTLYNATIDVRGTRHKDAIKVDGEDIEIRFFGENNIFADEEAYTTAIGSNRHSQTFIGADDAVLNLYGNVAVSDINIESGTVNVYGADVNDIESVYVEGYLVISDGAVLNIISGDNGQGFNCGIIAQKEIVAEGEFNAIALTGVETDNEIIYNLTAIGDAVLGADTYSPYYGMEIPEDMNLEVNFIVPEGASVTVPEGITLNLDTMTNVDIDGELIVYGTLICTHTGGEDTCDAPAVCDICKQVYGEKLTHTDEDGDYICDHGCGYEFEKPAEPTPEEPTPEEPTEDTICEDCGKVHDGFFAELICFFTRIINFIKNLFA